MRTRVSLIAALVAAALALGVLSSTAAAAVGPCTDVQFIGLRGSGEDLLDVQHNMGGLLGPMADAIAEQGQGAATFSFYGVPYKAGEANWVTMLSQSYFDSKKQGMSMLHDYLTEEIAACPSTKLVVMGYSQGAHAAGDQLAKEPSSVTDHVAVLVMFGDPRFNPDAIYDWGTFDPRDYGLNGKRSLSDFSSWSSRVFSFCNQNDIVCQGVGKDHSGDAHHASVYLDNYRDLAAILVARTLGFTRPAGTKAPLDLAFVIDSTGSMWDDIAAVSAAATRMTDTLTRRGADFHVGLVDYKDTDQGDPYASRVDLNMTSDSGAFAAAVQSLYASGGGDYPEAVYGGVMTAISQLSWRPVPRKAIILMGDAPAKDPEPFTGYTRTATLDAARALDPAVIYPLDVGGGGGADFQALADGSGGTVFRADGSGDVAQEMLDAVDQAALPLYVTLTPGVPARPSAPVLFSAAGSYYADGTITEYRWDFDNDGTVDLTTTTPRASHTYPAAFTGTASVTVITNDNHQASITASVDIRADAPVAAGAPTNVAVTAVAADKALHVAWQPPADIGGSAVTDYMVIALDASGEPVAQLLVAADARSVDIPDLPDGAYTIRVSAVTDYGPGAAATGTATLTSTWPFAGFFPPVDNPPTLNTLKAGAAVPVKFSLDGNRGLAVLAAGSPTVRQVSCASGAPTDAIEETVTANASGLQYDALTSTYTYVWKTAKSWAGTCRQLDVKLADGTSHVAVFRLH